MRTVKTAKNDSKRDPLFLIYQLF